MKFFSLRKTVASVLTASVVLPSAFVLSTSFVKEASAFPEKQEEQQQYHHSSHGDNLCKALRGKWRVNWKADGISYSGTLAMNKQKEGNIKIAFVPPHEHRKVLVFQDVYCYPDEHHDEAVIISGTDPRDPRNHEAIEDYEADTFLLEKDGRKWIVTHVESEEPVSLNKIS